MKTKSATSFTEAASLLQGRANLDWKKGLNLTLCEPWAYQPPCRFFLQLEKRHTGMYTQSQNFCLVLKGRKENAKTETPFFLFSLLPSCWVLISQGQCISVSETERSDNWSRWHCKQTNVVTQNSVLIFSESMQKNYLASRHIRKQKGRKSEKQLQGAKGDIQYREKHALPHPNPIN